ncbi:MAG: response regulator receiver protein [halophilic archaeon J07HB67]|nr:MAG: response regulator receiver protein [halophilic archaeon J07HB67]
MTDASTGGIDILLVEDNPADVRLTELALGEVGLTNTLHVVEDGREALAFLRREPAYADAVRPDLVLLDLDLPRVHGTEVLETLNDDDDLRRLPVIVLTSSTADEDVAASYDRHANAYVEKPVDVDEFMRVARVIEEFWLSTVKLPPE